MQQRDRIDFVTEKFNADRELFVYGDDFHRVPAHPERSASERNVIAGVLHRHKPAQEFIAIQRLAHVELNHPVHILLRRTKPINAGDGGNHYGVPASEKVVGCRMPQPLHLIVDRGILLNEGIGLGDVRLRLVVIVVGHEILNGVVGQEFPKFGSHLGGQSLIGLDDEGGALNLFDEPRRCCRFTGARGA